MIVVCVQTSPLLHANRRRLHEGYDFCGTVYFAVTFESVDEILKCDLSYGNYFPVVLFIVLYKVIQPLESVDKILKCENP